MILKLSVIIAFALLIVIVGIMGLRKTRSFTDFLLGGRQVGPWLTAFTYGTAYFSAVLFIGFAGKIGWEFGLSGLWVAAGNAAVGVLGVWWIMGKRIRSMSNELQVHTMPEYFEHRYNSRGLRLYASICIFVFFIPYSAAVFIGLSYLFQMTFGIGYTAALLYMGGLTTLYLVLGGYKSMTMIDAVFGMIMIVSVAVLLGSTLGEAGGLDTLIERLAAFHPQLTEAIGPPGWWPLFSLVFLTSVAPFAMPQLVQKFYAIRDNRSIRIGMTASTLFCVVIAGAAYFVGASTRVFLNPEANPAAFLDGRPIFDALMPEMLANVVTPSLSVLMLLLILSASMSTLAALVLISSSSVVKDFYSGFVNRHATDAQLTRLMRIFSAVFVALSVILAYFKPATIVSILGISWGAIGAAFLGPFVWGLFWRRCSKAAAVMSSVVGLGVCIWLYATGVPSPQAGTIGMILSLVIAPVIAALTHTSSAIRN